MAKGGDIKSVGLGLKLIGCGWYYLSTILDDHSRYIIAWKLCTTMRAADVTDTLELALAASGCHSAKVAHKPRLLSDNGSSYISSDFAEWLKDCGLLHVRGAPCHPETQGKIERWHQAQEPHSARELVEKSRGSNSRADPEAHHRGDRSMDNEFGKNLARKIVAVENAGRTGVREDVQKLLSPRFVGITRGGRPGTGEQEEDREQLIATIMSAELNSPLRVPSFDDQHSGAWALGDGCWVVKGKVATRNKDAPERDAVFRNTWIFCSDGGEWGLFSLQVTRLL